MIVKKMFGFLIDGKFFSHEELALEFEKLQAENKKLREALELIAGEQEFFDEISDRSKTMAAREALKEVGEV